MSLIIECTTLFIALMVLLLISPAGRINQVGDLPKYLRSIVLSWPLSFDVERASVMRNSEISSQFPAGEAVLLTVDFEFSNQHLTHLRDD